MTKKKKKVTGDQQKIEKLAEMTGLSTEDIRKEYRKNPSAFDLNNTNGEKFKPKPFDPKAYKPSTNVSKDLPKWIPSNYNVGRPVTIGSSTIDGTIHKRMHTSPKTRTGQFWSMSTQNRFTRAAGIVAGVAYGKNLLDKDTESMEDMTGDSVISGLVGGSAAAAGIKVMEKTRLGRNYMAKHLVKNHELHDYQRHVKDVFPGMKDVDPDDPLRKLKQQKGDQLKNFGRQSEYARQEARLRTMKGAGVAAIGAIALGTIFDVQGKISAARETERMVAEQENNLIREEKSERQTMQKLGYGNVDMGHMVFELFNERIGHHKMGNAKF